MAVYIDSSVLLAPFLDMDCPSGLFDAWNGYPIRLSSNLLKIECVISLRRAGVYLGLPEDSLWIKERLIAVVEYFDSINFKNCDTAVEDIIRTDQRLAHCRSLDAIHLATAEYFKAYLSEILVVCSLDKRMREAAENLGFTVVP